MINEIIDGIDYILRKENQVIHLPFITNTKIPCEFENEMCF